MLLKVSEKVKVNSTMNNTTQDLKPPQNPLSAYAFFFKETQASIKSSTPDATFEAVSKIVEQMWQSLEENQKDKYRKMNEADKERFKREKDLYDRGLSGPVTTTVRVATPATQVAPLEAEPGTTKCIRSGCSNPSVRNVEWEDEYCCNQCVVIHCDQVFKDWVAAQQKEQKALSV